MPAPTRKLWTVDEFRALPEDNSRRYELIDGILYVNGVEVPGGDLGAVTREMTPSPSWTHQGAVLALLLRLNAYVAEHRLGRVMVSPLDVRIESGVTVQPDLFVVPLVDGRRPRAWDEVGRLLLAVEVLSPSSARLDRVVKRRVYQRAGVPEYWIVDVDARAIERLRPQEERAELLADRLEWRPDSGAPPLVIELEEYFAEVVGE